MNDSSVRRAERQNHRSPHFKDMSGEDVLALSSGADRITPQKQAEVEFMEALNFWLDNDPKMDPDQLGRPKMTKWETLARYLAYFSDVGEAFRPVLALPLVRATYAVSWAYCLFDTATRVRNAERDLQHQVQSKRNVLRVLESNEAERHTISLAADIRFIRYTLRDFDRGWPVISGPVMSSDREESIMLDAIQDRIRKSLRDTEDKLARLQEYQKQLGVKQAIFHTVASMALPAVTINLTVRASRRIWGSLLPATATRALRMLPTATGLAVIPILPFLYDKGVHGFLEHWMPWRTPAHTATTTPAAAAAAASPTDKND